MQESKYIQYNSTCVIYINKCKIMYEDKPI